MDADSSLSVSSMRSRLLELESFAHAMDLASKINDRSLKDAIARRILDTTAGISEKKKELHLAN